MRAVELLKVAATAEGLRLKSFAGRQARRVGFAAGAAVFLLATLTAAHILAVYLLTLVIRPWLAIAIVLGLDALLAVGLGLMAFSDKPDRIEREAAEVRRRSLGEARHTARSNLSFRQLPRLMANVLGRQKLRKIDHRLP